MVVLLLVEIGVGIAGFVLKDEINESIEENMSTLMREDYLSQNATRNLFDELHKDVSSFCVMFLFKLITKDVEICTIEEHFSKITWCTQPQNMDCDDCLLTFSNHCFR